MKTYYTGGIQRRFVEHHIGKIQKRLRRKSIHVGWYLCAVLIVVLVLISLYGGR